MNLYIRSLLTFVFVFSLMSVAYAQDERITSAIAQDNIQQLNLLVNKENVNACFGMYSLLSQAAKIGAIKSCILLIEKGADVNKSCDGYVPPLLHAAKYGHLDVVKLLVTKGANIKYAYEGSQNLTNGPAKGETALSYAEKYHHDDVVEYLKSLIK